MAQTSTPDQGFNMTASFLALISSEAEYEKEKSTKIKIFSLAPKETHSCYFQLIY